MDKSSTIVVRERHSSVTVFKTSFFDCDCDLSLGNGFEWHGHWFQLSQLMQQIHLQADGRCPGSGDMISFTQRTDFMICLLNQHFNNSCSSECTNTCFRYLPTEPAMQGDERWWLHIWWLCQVWWARSGTEKESHGSHWIFRQMF